jgi:serine/threonine protein kinase
VEEDGQTWLVMEYVEGITLSAFVKRDGALTPDEAAPLMRQAADALAAAHGAGIVHRDVKPSNMLVNAAGSVKLTDFGIARAEADASLTKTGLVTGSPAYLAPEIASGATATEASDAWSLGATLFHLLTGHPPYDTNDNLMGALYKIVHEEPPRAQNAGWLAPLLEHTMTRQPGDRWSMTGVRDFLDRGRGVAIHPTPPTAVEGEGTRTLPAPASNARGVPPVPADPYPTPAAPVAPVILKAPVHQAHRSRWPWVAAAAVVLVVALIGGSAYLGSRDNGTPSGSPESPRSSTSGHSSSSANAGQASAMRSFITTYLSTVTSDQHASWAMLTPSFQKTSGGFGHYQQFWRGYSSATPREITTDPTSLSVSYAVDYVKTDGSTSTDQVTLRLVADGSSYLIDGEA